MITLSEDAKARYVDKQAELKELEDFVLAYEQRFRESFTPEADDALSIDEKATLLLASALASARQLTWSMVHAINGGLATALFLSVRAHSEMTGLVAYLFRELRRPRNSVLPSTDFEALLFQLSMGISHGRHEFPSHLNSPL